MSCSLLRKRDKPLRTYGKRSTIPAPDASREPPAKKLRLSAPATPEDARLPLAADEEPRPEKITDASKHTDRAEPSLAPETPSILSYFKPIPPARDNRPSTEATSKKPRRDPSPITHVVSARSKHRTRRLRAASPAACRGPTAASDEEHGEQREVEEARDDGDEEQADLGDGRQRCPETCDVRGRLLNQDRDGCSTDGAIRSAAIQARRPPRVQTTLNLSTRAAFAECKVCNTVWNPLYPDDAKYHAKHHAAVMRAKNKTHHDL